MIKNDQHERETKMEKMNINKIRISYVENITDKEMSEISGMWINEKSIAIFKEIKTAITYWLEQEPDQDFDLREIVDFAMPVTKLERAITIVETGLDDRYFALDGMDTISEANDSILNKVISNTVTAIAHAIEKDAI